MPDPKWQDLACREFLLNQRRFPLCVKITNVKIAKLALKTFEIKSSL